MKTYLLGSSNIHKVSLKLGKKRRNFSFNFNSVYLWNSAISNVWSYIKFSSWIIQRKISLFKILEYLTIILYISLSITQSNFVTRRKTRTSTFCTCRGDSLLRNAPFSAIPFLLESFAHFTSGKAQTVLSATGIFNIERRTAKACCRPVVITSCFDINDRAIVDLIPRGAWQQDTSKVGRRAQLFK